ncbi:MULTISPECIES: prohibitin family protein [Campylobacter]|uniref:Prohibitin family protein, SPFH superfamily n=1 Tax=Campylobacter curvus (strain 525.92) TaxID=360105 RepID=A7GWD7_CAMC5|nr:MULTISPECIES: prohibitin family protein [Campylobacter]EAU01179.1 prohibitin family protein, SPFH superfamily [Campylobacter curvus 525.92]MBN7288712.1 prohibitin family protein [Campylobacter curvus]MDU6827980.1 SPFH domain-containing protein [Campylobacter sp.]
MPADLNDYFNKRKPSGNDGDKEPKINFKAPKLPSGFGKFGTLAYIIIAIIAVLVITQPFVVINSGEVGIKATAGKYEPNPLQPGFHFFVPFIQKVIVVDTRVRLINYTSGEDMGESVQKSFQGSGAGIIRKNSISVLDARNLPVSIDITVQYRLNPENAPQTIASWGLSWESKIVDPVVRDVVRSIAGKYTAEELPTKRNEIATQIDDSIRKDIDAQPNRPVELLAVQLREIILPEKVKEQIERVQIAKQEAERTKYEVERANQEALKKAALAEGTAKAAIIEAKGKADAVKIEADAQAYANKEVAKSLDENLLSLKQIETQGKFNEALRDNTDAKIFLTPGGAVPNIWVDTKDKAKQSSATQR